MQLETWASLGVFAAMSLANALYGLTASGHFPSEHRAAALRRGAGAVVLWGSMIVAVAATGLAVHYAWRHVPWHWAIIAGGGMLLIAPLVLQWFSDAFVDGWGALLVFSGLAAVLVAVSVAL